MIKDFNKNWSFKKEGEAAYHVDLPHDAMLTEERTVHCPSGKQSGFFPGGKYIYEKYLTLNTEDIEKCIKLQFEGVYQNCTVNVNGKTAGAHRYGYTPFEVDISDTVKEGVNIVKVIVDNTQQPNCRWYSGSGIYRPVHLLIQDKIHISKVDIKTLSYNPAIVHIDVQTTQECDILVELFYNNKPIVFGAPGKFEIPNAKLWSADNPCLYTCIVKTSTDSRQLSFGIRKLDWSSKTGLVINGEEIKLRGGCIHHDHGVLGACSYPDAEQRRVRILKEAGYNAIRCAHNPASKALLDACDKLGMYVVDEAFDGWYIPKNYHDYSRWFKQDWREDIKGMVENSRNHPSVIMYSIGNEVSETAFDKGVEICRQMADYVRNLDDTRPVTAGINVLLNVYAHMGLGVYKDKGKYDPGFVPHVRKKRWEKKTGSAFFNAAAMKLGPLMFYMSKGKKGDKASSAAANHLDIVGLNYAASRYDSDVIDYPNRLMAGTETMIGDLAYNWDRVMKYKALIGDFCWAAWDYLGEAGIGDWTYYKYKGLPLLAGSGAIDITGKAGAQCYYQQVVWGLREKPFIGVRPVNHSGEIPKKSAWRFTDCIDSWSWQGYEGRKAIVEVYADAYAVRLLQNGKEIGTQRLKNYRTIFKTKYYPGSIVAQALDSKGKVLSSHTLSTGKQQTKLTIKTDKQTLKAASQDLCFVEIEFTDSAGHIKPYIEQRIELHVDGSAILVGFGSSLCKTDEVFDKTYHNSHRGRALAVLKAGEDVGISRVRVESLGVEAEIFEIEVI